MDIKIEPDDELLSSNGRSGIDDDTEMNVDIFSESHSTGSGFGVRVKQEIDEGDYNNQENIVVEVTENEDSLEKYKKVHYDDVRFIKEKKIDVDECSYDERKLKEEISQDYKNIKREDDIELHNFKSDVVEDRRPVKVEQFDVGGFSYVEKTPDQPQTTITKSKDPIEPPAITDLPSTSYINQVHIKKEYLPQEVNVVIKLNNGVFYERNFVCRICDDIFPSSHLLEQHVTSHALLEYNEGNSEKLETDIKIEPEHEFLPSSNQYSCDSDSRQNNMNVIWSEDHSIDIKHEALKVRETIIDHENHHQSKKTETLLHSGKKRFDCDQCSYRTTLSGNLKRHTMSHTGEKPFKCDVCSFRSTNSGHLKTHKMSHTGEKPFNCDQCSYRTAVSGSLKKHKMSHTGEKPFQCDQCSFRTADSGNLKMHKVSHTGEKPFNCDQCSYRTAVSGHLKRHTMSHTGEKPFKCDQCSFRSADSGYLKTHKMSHTGKYPLNCDQCSYKTALSGSLERHKISHTREKPFKCDQCNYRASRSHILKTHKMSHTGEKPFKCDQCSYRTTESGNLKRHKMLHSREKPSNQ